MSQIKVYFRRRPQATMSVVQRWSIVSSAIGKELASIEFEAAGSLGQRRSGVARV
jgi:hypothetical protein